jgi:manganese/iron transport system permease protein
MVMTSMVSVFVEPFRQSFMQHALVQVVVLGVVAGVAGVYVVLRRLAFVSDAMTHTVFPGAAIAFSLHGSVLLGAALAGVFTAVLLAALTAVRRVEEDAALAILLTSFFAVGVVIVSRFDSYTTDLQLLLFGRSVLLVPTDQIVQSAVVGAVALLGLSLLHKELVLRAFDEAGAQAQGYRPVLLDIALNCLLAFVIVAGLRTAGTLLTIALVIVPAVTARLLSQRIGLMIVLSASIGAAGGYFGLVVSYDASVHHGVDLAGGATIVVVLVALFLLALSAVPVRRQLARRREGPSPAAVQAL